MDSLSCRCSRALARATINVRAYKLQCTRWGGIMLNSNLLSRPLPVGADWHGHHGGDVRPCSGERVYYCDQLQEGDPRCSRSRQQQPDDHVHSLHCTHRLLHTLSPLKALTIPYSNSYPPPYSLSSPLAGSGLNSCLFAMFFRRTACRRGTSPWEICMRNAARSMIYRRSVRCLHLQVSEVTNRCVLLLRSPYCPAMLYSDTSFTNQPLQP